MKKRRISIDIPEEISRMIEANKTQKFIKTTSQYIINLILEDTKNLAK